MDSTIQWLADTCAKERLTEKWLIAADLRIAQQWKDQLNLRGQSTVNLHAKSLATLTLELVSSRLAEMRLKFAGRTMLRMLVRRSFQRLQQDGQLRYFVSADASQGVSDLLAASIRELRLADVSAEAMPYSAFESPDKAADLERIYQAYCEELDSLGLADFATCIEVAVKGLQDGSLDPPHDLLVLLPEPFPKSLAEERLLSALGAKASLLPNVSESPYAEAGDQLANRLEEGRQVEFFAAIGAVNEVRGVFQRILTGSESASDPLDEVEIVCADYGRYAPLVLEQLTFWLTDLAARNDNPPQLDSLPLTFAEGVACVYARPGRALRGWLRWISHDCVQSRAVQLFREGLLVRPEAVETIGYARLASTLRKIPIGFSIDRYLPKMGEAIQTAERSLEEWRRQGDAESDNDEDGRSSAERSANSSRDFGLASLQGVASMLRPLIELAPRDGDDALVVLKKAREFVAGVARVESRFDHLAQISLLDSMDGMAAALQLGPDVELDVLQWLQQLPLDCRVLAQGPQPGRLHVSSLSRGAQSGRRRTFLVGMNDGCFPGRPRVDPVLLDGERSRLSRHLPTSQATYSDRVSLLDQALNRALASKDSRACLSYSVIDLDADRSSFASPALLELYRICSQSTNAAMVDLQRCAGDPVGFADVSPQHHLSPLDEQISALLSEPQQAKREQYVASRFEHVFFQRRAAELQADPSFGPYDGYAPAAGARLDPAVAERVSPSRLECYGACPRRFYFRYGLGVYPPDEWIVDHQHWLDPLQIGNLVHSLFEDFLRELTAKDLIPDFHRDRRALFAHLSTKIDELQSVIPIPNQDSFRRTCEQLEKTCEIFLRKEEQYCREHNARPWVLEASLGLGDEPQNELDCKDPIPLTLADGRLIRIGGRLDRVDRLQVQGSERYAVWDYKSGSSYGFSQEDPFRQGRKLQHFLYLGMLRHRIRESGGSADQIESFGYFFPSPRTHGLRLRWSRGELQAGDQILQHISKLIGDGVFIATTDANDCRFCDYLSVCGDPALVAEQSQRKAKQAANEKLLLSFCTLRGIDASSEGAHE